MMPIDMVEGRQYYATYQSREEVSTAFWTLMQDGVILDYAWYWNSAGDGTIDLYVTYADSSKQLSLDLPPEE